MSYPDPPWLLALVLALMLWVSVFFIFYMVFNYS